jgi:hypothetical protein
LAKPVKQAFPVGVSYGHFSQAFFAYPRLDNHAPILYAHRSTQNSVPKRLPPADIPPARAQNGEGLD